MSEVIFLLMWWGSFTISSMLMVGLYIWMDIRATNAYVKQSDAEWEERFRVARGEEYGL